MCVRERNRERYIYREREREREIHIYREKVRERLDLIDQLSETAT